jgi:hypothetical protein
MAKTKGSLEKEIKIPPVKRRRFLDIVKIVCD